MAHDADRPYRWTEVVGEDEERERWRRASLREKGEALIDLLGLVDAIGRYPEPSARWPGFRTRGRSGNGVGGN